MCSERSLFRDSPGALLALNPTSGVEFLWSGYLQQAEESVLQDLGQRRMDPVLATSQFLHRLAEAHGLDHRLNQGGCLGTDDVGAEKMPGARVGQQFHEMPLVLQRPAERDIRITLREPHVRSPPFLELLLCGAAGGDLGNTA